MTIQDVKNDLILQVSSQETSTFSKYDFEDRGLLKLILSCQRAEIWHTSQESHIMTIHDVKNDPILQVSSQEPSTSSKYGLHGRGVLDTLLFKLESLNFNQIVDVTCKEASNKKVKKIGEE